MFQFSFLMVTQKMVDVPSKSEAVIFKMNVTEQFVCTCVRRKEQTEKVSNSFIISFICLNEGRGISVSSPPSSLQMAADCRSESSTSRKTISGRS